MKPEVTTEKRLADLEQSNRRLKVGLFAIGIFSSAALMLGAAAPAPKVISAERFVLMDTAGRERAELSANEKAAALQFLNTNGSKAIVLANGSAGNGIFISDLAGEGRVNLFASGDNTATISLHKPGASDQSFLVKDTPDAAVLEFRDGNNKARVDLGYTGKGASLVIADANETTRAVLAEEGAVTYKKGGELDWASFGEQLSPAERKRVMDLINASGPLK